MTKAFKALVAVKEGDLLAKKSEIEKELIKLRGQAATGASQKNPYALRTAKRTIARILTLIGQRKNQTTKKGETQA